MVSTAAIQKIVAELDRLIAEARGCLRAAMSVESERAWRAYIERLERRRNEISHELAADARH